MHVETWQPPMKHRWPALLVLLLIQHALFVALSVWLAPTEGSFAALFLAWLTLPALTAAVGLCASRKHVIAAAVNGAVAATLIDYLFLVHGYYWPERPEIAVTLALIYLLFGFGISTACGGFVHVIMTALDRHAATTMSQRITIAGRKGLTFSSLCMAITLPVLLLLWPAGALPRLLSVSVGYALGGIVSDVLVALAVGAQYAALPSSTSSVPQIGV